MTNEMIKHYVEHVLIGDISQLDEMEATLAGKVVQAFIIRVDEIRTKHANRALRVKKG
jgi:hypothetical protein